MRVLVTGASGHIGRAVVRALVQAGHQVTGLVRSADKEAGLRAIGGQPLRGDLADPASYRDAAAEHEACVHLGFEQGSEGSNIDHRAITTLLAAAPTRRAPRVVIYTSGVLVLGNTGDAPADESASTARAIPLVAWRPAHERLTLGAANDALVTAVVRPGFVHGGRQGVIAGYFESAVTEGAALYVGDGRNRMSLVHRDDLAQLYRLVVERRGQGIFHGVDGAAPRVAELARAASEAAGSGGATRSLPVEEAAKAMGPFASALCTDQVVVAGRAAELGWTPAHRPFLEDPTEAFQEWRTA